MSASRRRTQPADEPSQPGADGATRPGAEGATPPGAEGATPPGADGATIVYTDGACRGNPGPGGWAWAIPGGRWASGADPATTNQRMEIAAVLDAVRTLEGPLHIVSDSTYVVNCFRDGWWKGWLKRGWKNSKKEPVANRDLWEPLIDEVRRRDITFSWVKGHSGDPMNDLVDRLAVAACDRGGPAAGDVPPAPDQLGEPDSVGAGRAKPQVGSHKDSRVPAGTLWTITGLRSEGLVDSPRGEELRRELAAVLAAQRTMFEDLVVLTGLRPGAEHIGALAAADAQVPYVVVLPYPDPTAGWPESERGWFDTAVAGARDTVVLEKKRPSDLEGRRSAMARRDGWLRSSSHGAIVVTDGRDPEAELALRRYTEVIGEDVWPIDLDAT